TREAAVELGAQPDKIFQPGKSDAGAGFERMRFALLGHVRVGARGTVNAWNDAFKRFQFGRAITGVATGLVPGRMTVVAVNKFGADAADFASRPRALDVAKVGEEIQC